MVRGQSPVPPWRVALDRGGTFTDCVAWLPGSHEVRVAKLLSRQSAPLDAIRRALGLGPTEPLPPCEVRIGTTIATNSLLERRGARTALVITRGFGDLMYIGDQTRPDLFDLYIRRPPPLHESVLEVGARLDKDGRTLERPEEDALRSSLEALRATGIESIAISVLHAYRDGALEDRIADIARDVGFPHVVLSHESLSERGLLPRTSTTLVDAFASPKLVTELRALEAELPRGSLHVMQSSGSLAALSMVRAQHAVLSGPAGGAMAVARIAARHDLGPTIGFDMGGTSTDVSRVDGEVDRRHRVQVAGLTLRTSALAVHTVAAGGGSLCYVEQGRLRVGPQSAGASPGPLCYGDPTARALALTDIALYQGRLVPARFPLPLDRERVEGALEVTAASLGPPWSRDSVSDAFFDIAVEHMAMAILEVSVARGYDVRGHALCAFGGASGQYACAVARRLGMPRVVFHPFASVLSAYGIGLAERGWDGVAAAEGRPLASMSRADVDALFVGLLEEGKRALGPSASGRRKESRRLELRYLGAEATIEIELAEGSTPEALGAAFEAAHLREIGYRRKDHPVVIANARVAIRDGDIEDEDQDGANVDADPSASWVRALGTATTGARSTQRLRADGRIHEAPIFTRDALGAEDELRGPAIVVDDTGCIVIEPGFKASLGRDGALLLEDESVGRAQRKAPPDASRPDPMLLEVFHGLFMSIAERMGHALRRAAVSTNIRERLDFSCAVFDRRGHLVANAPHIPVHLGAMGESVRAVLEAFPSPEPGDAFITNDPARGGSHLPDITVVSPVLDARGEVRFFVASRGHHADIGGLTPGSMPSSSSSLEEEGVLFRPTRVARSGVIDEDLLSRALRNAPYPARDPAQNIGDIGAQISSNALGLRLLEEAVQRFGLEVVEAYMQHIQDNARAYVREAIDALGPGERRFTDTLDDGSVIAVAIEARGGRLRIDFSGTSPEVGGNLNAPRAITVAAVLYALRCLVRAQIPLNEGCLADVDLHIPPRSLLDPGPGRAVVAGNVETSQRVVDVLLGALGLAAASQGTMNNLSFGDESFGYYETIAGGAGAGPGFDGASGVHTHMTNTRITDPETLEASFPVRLRRFSLRAGSGGAGQHRGGEGVVRELEALAPLSVSILSERRVDAPFGLEGGAAGARGRNLLDGRELGGRASFTASPGQVVTIETPGGGGYGRPEGAEP